MAPLPQNSTTRYFVDYTTGRKGHTISCRVSDAVDESVIGEQLRNFLDALAPLLVQSWTIIGVRRQLALSDFTLPYSLDALDGFVGAATATLLPPVEEPRAVTYVGRGLTSGRKVSVAIYGLDFTTPSQYSVDVGGTGAPLEDARAALELSSAFGVFWTIAEDAPLWYDRATVNYNSYWERDARG